MKKVWINIAKGIGISLVVLGHSNIPFVIVRYIQSFHMPLFFFISGYLYHERSCMEFLKRKINTLATPYIGYSIIYLIIYLLLGHSLIENTKFAINTLSGTQDLLWFLVVLFFTENIFNGIKNIITKERTMFFCILLIGIIGHLLSYYNMNLYFRLDIAMVAIVMFYCGYLTNAYLKYKIKNKGLDFKIFIIVLALSIICCFANTTKVDMRVGEYGNIILYYISALSGIYCVFYIALMIKKERLFEFLGQNSMTIYAYNVFIPISVKEFIKLIFKDIDFNVAGNIIIKLVCFIIIFSIIIFENHLRMIKNKNKNISNLT